MRRRGTKQYKFASVALVLCVLVSALGRVVHVGAAISLPSLVISQLKITSSSGQLIVLYNQSPNALDMSKYQVGYFNHYDLAKATSSKFISLSGSLPPHSFYIISDDTTSICYPAIVQAASLGFSSTAGFMVVSSLEQSAPGAEVVRNTQDFVGWSKVAANGAQTLPANTAASLLRQPLNSQNHPEVDLAGAGSWLPVAPSSADSCLLAPITAPSQIIQNYDIFLLPSTEPPFTIASNASVTDTPVLIELKNNNPGLMAPKITELLPNPLGSGNDAEDEFIELYNPNPVQFDLSGFTLQTGVTGNKKYTFPDKTYLAPLSFTAFYSAATKLSLSNTSGQAALLDPSGKIIDSTEVYKNAKDGESWALGNGKWSWSITTTPAMANILNAPPKKTSAKSSTAKNTSASKASKSKGTTKASKSSGAANSSSFYETALKTPIHKGAIALVASSAILYAAYEYRTDLTNRFHQFRRYFKAGRQNRE